MGFASDIEKAEQTKAKEKQNVLGDETKSDHSLETHPPSRFENGGNCDTPTQTTAKTAVSMSIRLPLPVSSSNLQLVSTGTELVNLDNERTADLCCGVCCDLVKGCIIVDCCDIALSVFLVVLSALGYSEFFIDTINFSAFDPIEVDDDELLAGMEDDRKMYAFVTAMTALGIFFSLVGIYGSLKFKKWMVLSTAIWFCVDVIRCAVTLQWINTVVTGCYAYPHIALFMALKSGKISKERYPVEKHCCCV